MSKNSETYIKKLDFEANYEKSVVNNRCSE